MKKTEFEVGDLVGFLEYSIDEPRRREVIDVGYVVEIFPIGHDLHNYLCIFWQGLGKEKLDNKQSNLIVLLEKGNKNVSD